MKIKFLLVFCIGFSFSIFAQESLTKIRGSYNSLTGYVFDQDHNLYSFGAVDAEEAENVSILPGATQNTFGGGNNDGYIEKRSPDGDLLWNTFIGGEGRESVSVEVTPNGIYIVGYTTSQDGISTPGAFTEEFKIYDSSVNLSSNQFIIKLNQNGTKEWGTYFRSTSDDIVEGVTDSQVDDDGNIYIVGHTESPEGITTTGAFDTQKGQAYQKGFIVKFDANGNREWGTYYGTSTRNSGFNALNSIAVDNNGNIIVAGNSALGIPTDYFTTEGAYNDNQNVGGGDVLMAKFDTDGNRLWGLLYGGIDIELNLDIAVDSQNNIIWAGVTRSTEDIASPEAYQDILGSSNPINGQNDLFLAKFDESGHRLWSTYYGGRQGDFSSSQSNLSYVSSSKNILAFDETDKIYISGLTKSEQQIATQGTFQDNLASVDSSDAYIAKFDTSGNRLWGTYFGGQGEESKINILYDQNQGFYLFGQTGSSTNIATSNGWWDSSMQGNPSGFIVKFKPENLSVTEKQAKSFKIFPNPSSGNFTIASDSDQKLKLSIFDLQGRRVKSISQAETNQSINMKDALNPGLYFIKIVNKNQKTQTMRLLVK
jgi:hypothetical protein